MALLSEADRWKIAKGISNYLSQNAGVELTPYSVAALKTAVDETDSWIDTNQSGYNSSLSEPFASGASATQKTLLFMLVAAMRQSPEFLAKLVGS